MTRENLSLRPSVSVRELWIDSLRGLAILLVIADHSAITIAQRIGNAPQMVEVINDAANPFRMATLMFLSGMLLPQSLRKTRRRYVWGKLSNIAWPYVLWSCIILGIYAAGYAVQGKTSMDWGMFLRIFYSPPTLLWYLAYLLVFYLVVAWLPIRAKVLLIPATMTLSILLAGDTTWQSMFYLFGFFLTGDLAARTRDRWEPFTKNALLLTLTAGLAALAALASASGIDVRYQALWAPAVLAGIFIAIPIAKAAVGSRIGRFVAAEGRESIVYYITHSIVLLILSELLVMSGVRNGWVLVTACLLASLMVGWIAVRARRRFRAFDVAFKLPG